MLRLISALLLSVVVFVLWLPLLSELISWFRRGRSRLATQTPSTLELPRLLFLVPAHDEELMISECARSLLGMDYPAAKRRVVIIADNCSDRTAAAAQSVGAEAMIRIEPQAPGKPRAIAWALKQLALTEWDACIIVDADSTVAPDFALAIAKLAPLNDIAFQANFGVLNEYETWLTRLGGVLSRIRYEITYPLKQGAGLNCPITGNGMGFGTNLLLQNGWPAFSITEDSELYAIYTAAGVQILHASGADLFSQEARSLGQGVTQRRRWLAGRLNVVREWSGQLLRSPNIGWHQKLDAIVELGLASPVVHLLVAAIVVAFAFIQGGVAGLVIAALAVLSLAALALSVVVVILRHPQPWRTVAAFCMLPLYAGWRLLVVARTLTTLHDTAWRKTARTAPIPAGPSITSGR